MSLPTPSITIVPGKATDSPAYAEAFWRHPMPDGSKKPKKRRLGRIWVERIDGEWVKRKGRTPDEWLDLRTMHKAAAAAVEAFQAELEAEALRIEQAGIVTFRQVAREWLEHKRTVKGATPKTLQNDESLLAEPGAPHKRGSGVYLGRILGEFGDDPVTEIDPRRVSGFLGALDKAGLEPRNVNAHRSCLHAVFTYAMRPDTYALPSNPVAGTDRRKEPPKKKRDYYEITEVETLADIAARGKHRDPAKAHGSLAQLTDGEIQHRRWEDEQDADFYRVLFGTGLRLGELRDQRVGRVEFSPDMCGGWMTIESRLSAGESIPGTKSNDGEFPTVPIPEIAARACARQLLRLQDRFGREPRPNDLLFPSRDGGPLSDSALRRRYKRACAVADLRVLRLHDLRHAAGSLVGKSSSAVFTRDFLRHSKLATTDRYTHSKMRTQEALDEVNRAFAPKEEA